jgi:dihydroorotate dehydrogenase (NAD+) catalytic subunit
VTNPVPGLGVIRRSARNFGGLTTRRVVNPPKLPSDGRRAGATTRVGDVTLPGPIMCASGTAGHSDELAAFMPLRELGGVVVKSLAPYAWAGNPAPRVHALTGGMLNSVGLQGPGIAQWIEHDLPRLERRGATTIVSVWGRTVDDYGQAVEQLKVLGARIAAIELNLSCPNLDGGKHLFAHDPSSVEAVLAVTSTAVQPRWAKLSPNTDRLVDIAGVAHANGINAVTLVNTLLGMVIDLDTGRPVLGTADGGPGSGGGLSGPAMHAVAVRAVWEVHVAHPTLPIIGVGGVATWHDAREFQLAGACAVQVGTATFANPRAAITIQRQLLARTHTFTGGM